MGTKAEMLSKLNEEYLEKMAQNEGITIVPKPFKKRQLVIYLGRSLTTGRIEEYITEYVR